MSFGFTCSFIYLSLLIVTLPKLWANPVINELMFHPPGDPEENIQEEWIELYNPSESPVDLSGWQFTKGVSFIFPEGTHISANGFLIVAANTATFRIRHPHYDSDIVGNWDGRLSNDSETIKLTGKEGELVDQLEYATQGDWAQRTQTEPEREIEGWIWANKADGEGHTLEKRQPIVSISSGMAWAVSTDEGGTPGATNSSFEEDIAPIIDDVAHHPIIPRASETITITAQVSDHTDPNPTVTLVYRLDGDSPWETQPMMHDGNTYETIIGPYKDRDVIEYYIEAKGTHDLKHTWPRPSKQPGGGINLSDVDVFEQFNNALIQVDDTYVPHVWNPGSPPRYRIIMTAAQRQVLKKAQDLSSGFQPINVAFHATFVSEDGTGVKVRHNAAVRDRGFSSRSGTPVNYHVAFPSGDRWNGRKSMQLNSRYPFSQALGAAMFQLAGLSTTEAVPVEVFLNGHNTADGDSIGYGRYVRAEPINADWIERLFPSDADGNLYRIDDHAALGTGQFDYAGENASPYDITYLKKTNEKLHDYSDIIALTKALNQSPPESFRQEVDKIINLRQWLRYLATNALIANQEGGLGTGRADDFAIYRGIEDPRFILLPHDLDTVMSIGERDFNSARLDIFVYRRLNGLKKLLSDDAETIREFYQVYLEMLDDWFNSETIDPVIEQIFEGWIPDDKITKAKRFVVERRNYVLSRIPQENVTIPRPETPGRINGRLLSTSGSVRFDGRFHVGDVGSILIGGHEASLSYGEVSTGQWTWNSDTSILSPGVNVIDVDYYAEPSGQGDIVHTDTFEVFYRQPVVQVSQESFGEIDPQGVIRWAKDRSPFHLVSDVTIPPDTQLQIDSGVQVYVQPGVRLTIEGTLQILGQLNERVRFGPHPQADPQDDPLLPGLQLGPPKWGGIRIIDSLSPDNKVLYTDIVHAQLTDNKGSIGVIRSECFIDHCTFSGTHYRMVYGRNCSLTVQYCNFPDMFAEDENPVAIGLDNVAEQLKVESANFPEIANDPRFVGGFPVGGHFRVYHNNFYGNKGHNDVLDADSGRWGISPVLDCRYNHFHGPVGDEHMDLGGDAYVAFNIFENVSKDEFTSDRGYANAISTGDRGSGTTVVVAGNVFRKVEHAINCKVNTATIFEHNTCLDLYSDYEYRSGNIQQNVQCSAVNLFVPDDIGPTPGDGAYLGFNVFHGSQDAPGLFTPGKGFPRLISWADRDLSTRPPKKSRIQFYQNLIDPDLEDGAIGEYHPGGVFDPQWGEGNTHGLPETQLAPYDLPFGAGISEWAYINGVAENSGPDVALTIGGPGIFAYRWRLDNGSWSDPIDIAPGEFPRDQPIVRTAELNFEDLGTGSHRLEVLGQDFAGNWQPETNATTLEWEVVQSSANIVFNEIRAIGEDALEIFNRGPAVDLTGWSISENPDKQTPYLFRDGTEITAGDFLVVDNGVTLDRDGDALFLIDPEGTIRDEIRFGYQPTGYTLGRLGDTWHLCEDTIGSANRAVLLGSSENLRINEVLAAANWSFRSDWIELHNDSEAPITLAGYRLTDNPAGDPFAHVFPPHTYLAPNTYWKLDADGTKKDGSVNFALDAEGESLSLLDNHGHILDQVLFQSQSQDRTISWTATGVPSIPLAPTDAFDASPEELARMRLLLDHLRITEIHNESLPRKGGEFVELTNTGDTPLDLSGVRFVEGIEFTFPEMVLEPGAYTLVVRSESTIRTRFPDANLPIAGMFNGKLHNKGETLTLSLPKPFGAAILDFRYEHNVPGTSLELVATETLEWQRGTILHGTPGGFTNDDGGYGAWAQQWGISSPESDDDGDGWPALLEYALDRDPTRRETAPALSMGRGPLFFGPGPMVVFRLGANRPDITYTIESSVDLQNWSLTGVRPAGRGWDVGFSQRSLPDGGTEIGTVFSGETAAHVRLRVELP